MKMKSAKATKKKLGEQSQQESSKEDTQQIGKEKIIDFREVMRKILSVSPKKLTNLFLIFFK